MNEKLLQLLKTKFAGVQDAVLQRVVKKHSASLNETSTDEQIQGVVDGISFQTIIDSYTESRVTEASKNAVANYEQKYNLKEGVKVTALQQQPNLPNDAPDWAKQLIQQNATLQDELKQIKQKGVADSLSTVVKAKLKEKGVKDSFFAGREISITNESEVDSLVETMLGQWNEIKKDFMVTDVPPERFNLNAGEKSIESDIDNWVEKTK